MNEQLATISEQLATMILVIRSVRFVVCMGVGVLIGHAISMAYFRGDR